MKTVDLLQVVYEHWAKPRDIEEKEILKSSIGSTLPTCIHCVICKSNNLFFFFWCLSASDRRRIVSQNECVQDVRELRSFMMRRWFFLYTFFYVKTWTGWANMLLQCGLCLQSTFYLYLTPQCQWWKVTSFYFISFLSMANMKEIFEICNLPLWCVLKIFFLHASRLNSQSEDFSKIVKSNSCSLMYSGHCKK